MFKPKDRVRYVGSSRPHLKGLDGVVSRTSDWNKSSLVEFSKDGKLFDTVWVGAGGLEPVVDATSSPERILQDELKLVTAEYAEVYTQYNQLRNRKRQLENALAALKQTYNFT